MSLAKVGQHAGTIESTIWKIETGRRRVAIDDLPGLATVLDTTPADLIQAASELGSPGTLTPDQIVSKNLARLREGRHETPADAAALLTFHTDTTWSAAEITEAENRALLGVPYPWSASELLAIARIYDTTVEELTTLA